MLPQSRTLEGENRDDERKASKVLIALVRVEPVVAVVTTDKKVGCYRGRVAIRTSHNFNINTASELVQGISHLLCPRSTDRWLWVFVEEEAEMGQPASAALSLPGLKAEGSRPNG